MGVISIPVMMRNGYSVRHTMGVIAASGTITQLIPPSLVLVVLADQLGRSVGNMYLRGIAPPSVKTTDIYWGAIPWVFLQLILVAIVILWPESVTYWIEKGTGIDPSKVNIEIQLPDMPPPLDLK
jgi:TRAP-type mannitol/chloroaromatic compound transport system permease large subunit